MVEVGLVFWVKAVRLLRHFGILPKIWFKARSKSWRFLRWHRCEGMLPNKWLDRRKKITKFGWLLPNHIGICPNKLSCPRFINFNLVQFFKDEGISPLKLLLLKSIVSILSSKPIDLGIFPKKWLFSNLRIFNPSRCIQQSRSSPDNQLLERSKKNKTSFLIAHRDWIGFENIF